MFNLNRANRNAIMSIVTLIALICALGMLKNTSKYQARPITINAINEESLFNLDHRIECTPGHTSEGSTYTKSLTPGGLCASEKLVAEQAGGYEIEDGIGGSLI
ncbi:MAG: hypothetical protein CMA72_07625 [Euryarchaeota archaeon]|jgi:hypothetical protein|nr:hypothetical protein [Euryarchaeota archaeon]|tara:strand:- start:575 stop:886 length:312 start_codon:yes stop_codon:yes gene_type:complete